MRAPLQSALELEGLDTASIPFATQRHRARAGGFDLRGKAAVVGWRDEEFKASRVALPPLPVDRAGVYVFPLVRKIQVG